MHEMQTQLFAVLKWEVGSFLFFPRERIAISVSPPAIGIGLHELSICHSCLATRTALRRKEKTSCEHGKLKDARANSHFLCSKCIHSTRRSDLACSVARYQKERERVHAALHLAA